MNNRNEQEEEQLVKLLTSAWPSMRRSVYTGPAIIQTRFNQTKPQINNQRNSKGRSEESFPFLAGIFSSKQSLQTGQN